MTMVATKCVKPLGLHRSATPPLRHSLPPPLHPPLDRLLPRSPFGRSSVGPGRSWKPLVGPGNHPLMRIHRPGRDAVHGVPNSPARQRLSHHSITPPPCHRSPANLCRLANVSVTPENGVPRLAQPQQPRNKWQPAAGSAAPATKQTAARGWLSHTSHETNGGLKPADRHSAVGSASVGSAAAEPAALHPVHC